MKRCKICDRRIFPWERSTFTRVGVYDLLAYYHTPCYQRMQRIYQEDADRWERQAKLRWEEEDRL